MGAVLLTGQRMILESESYIDAMHGILFPMGWIACSKSMLAGMSAAAFRFTVNRRLTPESVTAYNWMAEHFLAADFLGVTASQNAGFYFQPTFPLYQRQAVAAIKDSLDRGTGAVIWKDKFVIAAGYDDEREVLYISDGTAEDYEALPYGDFGCNRSPYWYVQTFETRIESDEMEIYLESLLQAIYKWESHDLMLPEKEYACGRSAYGAIIHALRGGHYDPA
ncbi:hypothetical protein K0U00_32720, partial [Paenibacillus sepulcri]|nr:hypothetical protein [Paenibacillus sepulcri]